MKLANYMQEKLANMLNTTPTPDSPLPRARLSFDDVPPELVHEILMLVPQPSVLSFGLTSRRNYELCQPALHYRIVLTHTSLNALHFPKIARDDPALLWVKELKIGDPSGCGWDVLSDSSILTVFPNLCLVDAVNHAPMRGWAGLLHVLSSLPSTMAYLSGNIYLMGDSDVWSTDRAYTSYKTLSLTFKIQHRELEVLPGYCTLPPTLSVSFPNLVVLSLEFDFLSIDVLGFWIKSYFPALTSFTLIGRTLPAFPSPLMSTDEEAAVAGFFTRHAPTLRKLCIPTMSLSTESAPQFSSVPWKLCHLQACAHTICVLAESPALSVTLQTLDITACYHSDFLPPRVLDSVHTLHAEVIDLEPTWWGEVACLAPGIHTVVFRFKNETYDYSSLKTALTGLQVQQDVLRSWKALEKVVVIPAQEEAATFVPVRDDRSGYVELRPMPALEGALGRASARSR